MRSLVADIFHSLSRNCLTASSLNSSFWGPSTRRITRHDGWQIDAALRSRSCGRDLQFISGLQRTVVGTAKADARIHRKTSEHRLALEASFDREIAEGTVLRHSELQGLAIGDGGGAIPRDGASCDLDAARRTRKRHTNRATYRFKGRSIRADLDRRRKPCVPDQTIGRCEAQPVHCAAGRQPITLGTEASAVLHRACRADREYSELGHAAPNWAMISPPIAARSCSA